MKWREIWRDYFTFTRKERIGLIILVILIFVLFLLPHLIPPPRPHFIELDKDWIVAAQKLKHKEKTSDTDSEQLFDARKEVEHEKRQNGPAERKFELFYFDPNHLSAEGWERLGIRKRTVATIQKYLEKGGHFYKATDLKRIYGMREEEYALIEPFIHIHTDTLKTDTHHNFDGNERNRKTSTKGLVELSLIDINTADTAAFISLPGIGARLASRIISFREKLGGFYSIDQVGEVYSLPDSVFQKIKAYLKLENNSLRQININTAGKDELKSHPYIRWNLANAIVEYRNQHGSFHSTDELRNIILITEEIWARLKPYVTVGN